MSYEQIQADLSSLIVDRRIAVERAKITRANEYAETVKLKVSTIDYLIEVIEWGNETERALVDWLQKDQPELTYEQQGQISDDRPGAFARIADDISRERNAQ